MAPFLEQFRMAPFLAQVGSRRQPWRAWQLFPRWQLLATVAARGNSFLGGGRWQPWRRVATHSSVADVGNRFLKMGIPCQRRQRAEIAFPVDPNASWPAAQGGARS